MQMPIQLSLDIIKAIASSIAPALALIISIVALYFTRVNWRESNRPILCAYIAEDSVGAGVATFNLFIANVGNRPAVKVRLHASRDTVLKLVDPIATPERIDALLGVFSNESEIPLLKNGEELSTSFGIVNEHSAVDRWLKYGSQIDIAISYDDLDNRKFRVRMPLRVYARDGFGGSVWKERLHPDS